MRHSVEAATGLVSFSRALCASLTRDVDLNLSKRIEVRGQDLDSLQVDRTLRTEFPRYSAVESKHTDLCSFSDQDLNEDLDKRVDTDKILYSFCLTENVRTVLKSTFNVAYHVDDDLDFFSADHSRNGER